MRRTSPLLAFALLALAKTASAQPAASDEADQIALENARDLVTAGRLDEAIIAFRNLADNVPTSMPSRGAAIECLGAMNRRLAESIQKPADIEFFSSIVRQMAGAHCANHEVRANAEPCMTLLHAGVNLARVRAWPPPARGEHDLVIQAELDVWRQAGEALCRSKSPLCAGMDELLTKVAAEYEESGRQIKALVLRRILIDPAYSFGNGFLYAKAACDLGRGYTSIGVFDRAAEHYQICGAAAFRITEGPRALERAVRLRLSLGDEAAALAAAGQFEQRFGKTEPTILGMIALLFAERAEQEGDLEKARAALAPAIKRVDRSSALDIRMRLHALLGRVAAARGQKGMAEAESEYALVEGMWQSSRLDLSSESDERERAGRQEGALSALGEALFFAAERAREKAGSLSPPPYNGPAERKAQLRYARLVAVPWLKRATSSIEKLEESYRKVAMIKPAPPPEWLIAANERVGSMWAQLAADLDSIPPRAGSWAETLREAGIDPTKAYVNPIDSPADSARQRAKKAYALCKQEANRALVKTEAASRCGAWLTKNHRAEHPPVDELFDVRMRLPSGLPPAAPVRASLAP